MSPQIPHLVETKVSKQLVVNGKPFLMLGGELQNSSLSSGEYMDTTWQNLVDSNFNTILGAVTWEVIEPQEGQFNFEELDKAILGARKHGLRLVLLWFGSFKNGKAKKLTYVAPSSLDSGMSTYAPAWVKTDSKRFPRAKLRKAGGVIQTADVLSVFHSNAMEADATAFGKLLAHVKEVDEEHSTVIMVQVENEVGLLGDSRDGSPLADEAFAQPIPGDLVDFLRKDWGNLHPDLKSSFPDFGIRKLGQNFMGSWETVLGKGPKTDELFMAYHYARYVNHVAAAGKKAYPLPLYTNVWLNYVGDDADNDFPVVVGGGGNPGDYPSGGSTSNVLDIWQRFAPSLDFVSPDVYLTDYTITCAKFRHRNQPLFIPEQRRDAYGARRVWVALGSYAALGTSPFGVDTVDAATSDFTRTYGLLASVSDIVLEAQTKPGSSIGFYFDEMPENGVDTAKPVVHTFGGYEITIDRSFVFGKPGPGEGLIIHQGGGKFLLIGFGFQVKARAISGNATFTGILRFEEKTTEGCQPGGLRTVRTLNGDETRGGLQAVMPNSDPDYGGFPICVTIPSRTMIAEVEFYHLEE
ncbi:hypothetical protein NM208_g7806 [Fusarium decemcellulare]|uniref:Uncharacterized protein n=1 Tax=Fusarium decemcellulare TaxID=57161 RepID=A0ACC1S7V9_9HYPO|nr:hypothetical protein NM208_g7806 [Fusarium decemcellulare]